MKVIVLHSGGLDSTCLLLRMLKYYPGNVATASVDYGQRHVCELSAAEMIRKELGITTHFKLDFSRIGPLLKGSSQTDLDVEVPEGHYAEESMKLTIVPNRNMLMLAAAASVGIANGYEGVAFAAHSGDHAIYPDCRPQFVMNMQLALDSAVGWDWAEDDGAAPAANRFIILAPFINMTKAELLANTIAEGIDFPWELTWSCYKGKHHMLDVHCGKCGTCVERKEAFRHANVEDKTQYED